VFDPLANVLKGLKQRKPSVSVNCAVNVGGSAQRKRRCDGSRVCGASGGKPNSKVEKFVIPNLGAGHILPLLRHVIGQLEAILGGRVHLETCRPLAFYLLHGVMER
jgi:hypothetical protein